MKKYILILGGTGAMGVHLSQIFTKQGYEVFVTTRRDMRNGNGITFVKGDAHNLPFLNSLLRQKCWDAIVDFMVYSTKEFYNRYELLLNSTNQYVYISSARVYADSPMPITENSHRLLDVCQDSAYLATDEYALAKARQEDILFGYKKNNWTVIRPYKTFSEQRIQLSSVEKEVWLFRALQGKTIFFSEDLIDKYTTLTYGFDVARGINAIIGRENALGECFHITNNKSYKWIELFKTYLNIIEEKTGKRPKVIMQKEWSPLVGGSPLQVKWDCLFNRRFDNSKIGQFIDVNSFKETVPAIKDCISVFVENPKFKSISWVEEGRRDRKAGEWNRLSVIPTLPQQYKYIMVRMGLMK